MNVHICVLYVLSVNKHDNVALATVYSVLQYEQLHVSASVGHPQVVMEP
jgi:hypothetical protein